jgi:endoglucanase
VAAAFASNPLVIGYDLKNEPRTATIGGTTYTPSWGDGNSETDFCQLYTSTATGIQAADGTALFFCEGLSYAGDLTGTQKRLVTPGHGNCVVYSMHDYAWYHPSGQSRADYITAMNKAGGFLMTEGTAPVWIGEFGTGNDSLAAVGASPVIGASSPSDGKLGAWFNNFLAWAGQTDVDWCWWMLDGTMCRGTTPQTNQLQFALGDRSGYGLFAQDWTGVSNPALLEALQHLQRPVTGPGV